MTDDYVAELEIFALHETTGYHYMNPELLVTYQIAVKHKTQCS